MTLIEIFGLALALSMDAFAVSLAAGATGHLADRRASLRMSFHFGVFQFLMPILGWALGSTIEPTIARYDHWVAFGLLALVGLRMIRAGCDPSPARLADDPSRGLTLLMLSMATSLDALAVGLSLAMIGVSAWYPSAVIGVVTTVVCLVASSIGSRVGPRVGPRLGKRTELVGGLILLAIGVRIVVSHMS